VADAKFVPIAVDFETEGQSLYYRMRVDERDLEPTHGGCRGWFLRRVARDADSARRRFCDRDEVRFYVEAGADHTVALIIGSEHKVAERHRVQPGRNRRWTMPITTKPFELPIHLEPGYSYTMRANEEGLNPRKALAKDGPAERTRDLAEYEPIFYRGIEVGTLVVSLSRDSDRQIMSEVSVPIYSGTMRCESIFCEPE